MQLQEEFYALCTALDVQGSLNNILQSVIKGIIMNTLTAGTPAPAFFLPDQNGNPVTLADFAGKKFCSTFTPKP